MIHRNIELLIVMAATLAPFWFMASSLSDLSELKSTGIGVASSAAVLGAYRAWQGKGT